MTRAIETRIRFRILTLALSALLVMALAVPPPAAAQGASALARSAAADYLQAARYPASSRPVPAGRPDPILAARTPQAHSLAGPDGAPPRLEVWPARVGFVAPEPVDLYATLRGAGGTALAGAVVTGRVRDESGAEIGSVTYADDGVGPDRRAGDGVYSARFEMPVGAAPALAAADLVEVLATLPDGTERKVAAGFLYSRPWARLTGRYRDSLVDGSLVVATEVAVERAGRFYLEGTLHTMTGEPVAWAQQATELAPGRHWVDLSFYGLALRDRGVAGPYRLGSVTLATTGDMPNALGPVVADAFVTRPVRLDRLTAAPFGAAGLEEAARRLAGEGGGER